MKHRLQMSNGTGASCSMLIVSDIACITSMVFVCSSTCFMWVQWSTQVAMTTTFLLATRGNLRLLKRATLKSVGDSTSICKRLSNGLY